MLPNLIVIGAQKCGTTSLHQYLRLHPEISMSQPKELDFFVQEHNWRRGLAWYERHFDREAAIRGESSPSYTNYPEYRGVPERMAQLVPDSKLIYLVGDPLKRIVSHYIHHYAAGGTRLGIDEELGDPDGSVYVAHSLYFTQLSRYLRVFPESSMLVIAQEDLLNDRLTTLRRVFRFLGVSDSFSSPGFDRLHHPSAGKQVDGRPIPAEPAGAVRRRLLELLKPDADRLRAHTGLAFESWPV
jgi:sulfotransferase family protein